MARVKDYDFAGVCREMILYHARQIVFTQKAVDTKVDKPAEGVGKRAVRCNINNCSIIIPNRAGVCLEAGFELRKIHLSIRLSIERHNISLSRKIRKRRRCGNKMCCVGRARQPRKIQSDAKRLNRREALESGFRMCRHIQCRVPSLVARRRISLVCAKYTRLSSTPNPILSEGQNLGVDDMLGERRPGCIPQPPCRRADRRVCSPVGA